MRLRLGPLDSTFHPLFSKNLPTQPLKRFLQWPMHAFPTKFPCFCIYNICLFFKQRDQEQYEKYNIWTITFFSQKLIKTNKYVLFFKVWLRPVILTFGLFVLFPFDLNLASRCVMLMWLIRLISRVNIIVKKFFWFDGTINI